MKNITTTLRELNPEAAKMWCYDLNGELTPDIVSGKSDSKAYFRCLENPNHIFSKKISKMTADDGHSYGCVYCGPNAKKVFPGETDFLSKCPEAIEMWDYELNEDIEPTKVFPKSNKYAHFKCEKGHSTYRKIMDFYRSPKCSECEKEKTKLIFQAPNTILFWNSKKNSNVKLDDIVQSSRYYANFCCPNCKYEWKWYVSLWNQRRYCPCCGFDGTEGSIEKNQSIIAQNPIITFRMANPEDSMMWNYDLNEDMTPDNTLYGSNKKVHFRCKKGHEFSSFASDMTTSDGKPKGCPYCKSKRNKVITGKNDFFTKCPTAKSMWNYEKNTDIIPEMLSPSSGVKAKFKCSKGHEFSRRIQYFTIKPVCPECDFIEKHSIAITKPDLMKFWDYEKNTLSPYKLAPYSKEEAFWKCKKCGHSWKQTIANRISSNKNDCPKCDKKTFRKFNPEASKLWLDEMNNGLTPDNVTEKSGKTIYMRCVNNPEHIYSKRVCNIPMKEPFGCPDCKKEEKLKIAKAREELAATYQESKANNVISNFPHMVKQWNFSKNKDIDINLKSAFSSDNVWWKCKKCNYEWQANIITRKLSKGLCPCCENRTVIVKGITDLFTLVPVLKQDYDYAKNYSINTDEISVSNQTPLWWTCHECGYEWNSSPSSRLIAEGESYKIRKCPACAGLVRTKSYAEDYPELIGGFLEDRNGCKFDELRAKDLNRNLWWHCDICGEDFEAILAAMIRSKDTQNKGCSFCAGKKVTRENSFAYLHPEVMDEYSPNNTIDPFNVTEYSTKQVEWVCRNNKNHTWEATFQSRANGIGGCNICRVWNYSKMLCEEYPEFEQYYDKEKNERPFKSYANMSNEYVWWVCENGHSFEWHIANFSKTGRFACPVCENKVLLTGENDLESQYPELAAEFDVEKNGVTPDKIIYKYNDDNIWWKCSEGHEFQRSIWYRVSKVSECPICNNTMVVKGINDFQTNYPGITKIWNYKKNEKKPDEVSKINNRKYSYICEHGHHYDTQLLTVLANDFKCMVCSGKIVQEGVNSLIDTHPELAKEFSPSNERGPETYHKENKGEVNWLCPTCNGEYSSPINEREVGDESCPYCYKNRALAGYNSLADTHPDLAKEFSLSNERGPETYHKENTYRAIWLCPTCGGEYNYAINERELGDKACPYCKGTKVLPGFNSFKQNHPDLMEEWDDINNYLLCNPDHILDTYSKSVWWNCKECNKKYLMSPKMKIYYQKRKMKACSYCKGLRRKKKYYF